MELTPSLNLPERKQSACTESNEYQDFLQENHDFFFYGPSQNSIKMIDNIISSGSISTTHRNQQLRLLVIQTYQETALNEIQVVYWSLLIERFVLPDHNFDLRLSLAFSALFTKENLDEKIEYLLNKYSQKEEFFREKYYQWCHHKNISDISTVDINKQYKKLTFLKENRINYNFYVDEIILQYLPYSHARKGEKKPSIVVEKTSGNSSPLLSQFNEEILPPIPLVRRTSSTGSKLSKLMSNQGSVCSQYLCFDV